MTLTLEKHVQIAADVARKVFTMTKGIMPMVHAISAGDQHMVMAVPQLGGSDAEKDAVAVGLRKIFKEKDVMQYVLMTEAWSLLLPPGTDIGGDLPRPRDSADRVEVITFQGEDKDRVICGQIVITRDEKGEPTLGKLETWDGGTSHGRLTGLLKTAN